MPVTGQLTILLALGSHGVWEMGVIQRSGNSCLHSPSLWSPLKAGPKCYFPIFPAPRGTWVLAFLLI